MYYTNTYMDWFLFGHLPRRNLHQDIIERSLYEQAAFKQVISPIAKELLSSIMFDQNIEEKECPIDIDSFKDGEELLQLPCKHLFRKSSIMNWLENRSAKCPVCRYQLPYIEVRNEDANDISDANPSSNQSVVIDDDISVGRSNLLSSLSQLYRINRNYF